MLNGVNLLRFWQGPRTILVGVGVALLNSSPPCLFLISGHFFMTAVFAPETLELPQSPREPLQNPSGFMEVRELA